MSGPYQVLMIDPPWPVSGVYAGHSHHRDAGPRIQRRSGEKLALPYQTLDSTDVWHLLDADIFPQADPHHALFMWTVEQHLTTTEQELEQRGYVRTSRLIWDKGHGPYITVLRRTHEYLLWYCKPRLLPIAATMRGVFPSVLREAKRGHSRKPSAAYAMVEALYPDARKLDAFTRELRPGWDGHGDQRDHFTPLLAPLRELTS